MPISDEERAILRNATRRGKTVRFRFPTDQKRRSVVGEIIDEVALIRDRHKIVIQQIRYPQYHLWDDDRVAYRLGYFALQRTLSGPPKVRWRNYSMLITESELDFLLRQARQKGWSIPQVFA